MIDARITADLLADIRADCGITWDDALIDRQLENYISGGMAYLDSKAGLAEDYSVPGFSRTLLFEYVRYARDKALDVFENNYTSMILAMMNERRVDDFAGTQNAESDD